MPVKMTGSPYPTGWNHDGNPHPLIEAQGNASPDVVAEHLRACLRVKDDKIATLELALSTAQIERDMQKLRVENQVKVLQEIQEDLRMQKEQIASNVAIAKGYMRNAPTRSPSFVKRLWNKFVMFYGRIFFNDNR